MTLRQLLKPYGPNEVVRIEFWGTETKSSRPSLYGRVKEIRKAFRKEILDKEVFTYTRQTSKGFSWTHIWLHK